MPFSVERMRTFPAGASVCKLHICSDLSPFAEMELLAISNDRRLASAQRISEWKYMLGIQYNVYYARKQVGSYVVWGPSG